MDANKTDDKNDIMKEETKKADEGGFWDGAITNKGKLNWLFVGIACLVLIGAVALLGQEIWWEKPEDGIRLGEEQQNGGALLQIEGGQVADLPEEDETGTDVNGTETQTPAESQNPGTGEALDQENPDVEPQADVSEEEVPTTAAPTTWLPPAVAEISRNYGYGFDETYQDYRFHGGLDWAMDMGEPVFAVAPGTVESAAEDAQWGGRVEISHGGGFKSVYLGLIPAGLVEGQAVEGGETIGTISPAPTAEAAQGSHLHLELWQDGERLNPGDYISSNE